MTARPDRNGPQVIPQPEGRRQGGGAPWAELADRKVTLEMVSGSLGRYRPRRIGRSGAGPPERTAAVLVPLYEVDGRATVLLTRRSPRLRSHSHEVSFPGGGHDPVDTDHWATALREAEEEIGLDPMLPRRLGELDTRVTVGSRSWIHPYVAALDEPPDLVADRGEVELILHVPLDDLVGDDVFSEELWPIGGSLRVITFFELAGDTVWGATASMLRQLLCLALGVEDRQQ